MSSRHGRKTFEVQDRYFHEAKRLGFKSRAAFKLQEIQKKYQLIKPGQRILDLGAAPGGWSQIALQLVGAKGEVLGMDLQEVELPQANFHFIQGDINDQALLAKVVHEAGARDVVISDLAPATSGIKFQDQCRSAELVRQALEAANATLKPGGHFVAKLFPSEELGPLKQALRNRFEKVSQFVPAATRNTSNELYLIAMGKI